jgi:RNA polymerase sigma-70 factor (ECF subfamily)
MSIETRASLLMRLRATDDSLAWSDFVGIYEPVIYRIARSRGLQDADAREVTQDVLLAVAGAIHRFDPDRETRFSGWLARITRNATIDRLRRQRERGSGLSDMIRTLQEVPETLQTDSAIFDLEHQRQVFRWAAKRVRGQVTAQSWQAFWSTAVDGESADSVAKQLSMTVGAVYVARCRVLAKIKSAVSEVDQ